MSIPQVSGISPLRRIAVLGGVTICIAMPLAAQQPPQAPPTEKECRTALRIVEKGHPAKKEAWALAVAPRCPVADAAPALAAMVRSLRAEADIAVLFEALRPTFEILDEGLLLAALDVIDDNTATMNSRIATTMMLGSQVTHGTLAVSFEQISSVGLGCELGGLAIGFLPTGAVPAAATLRSAVSRLRSVATAPVTPAPVRNAVECMLPAVEEALRSPWP